MPWKLTAERRQITPRGTARRDQKFAYRRTCGES